MKLSEFKKDYYEFSGLASNVSRQLAFAGIAIIWIFKEQSSSGIQLPTELLIPVFALILSLGSDLLQYLSGAIIWRRFYLHHEKHRTKDKDPDIEAAPWLSYPITVFFYGKIVSVLIAYLFLLIYCWSAISFS